MSEREREILAFLRQAGWEKAGRVLLPQDASTRRYHRLRGARGDAILMDAPPGGDQLKSTAAAAYNRTAHLAADCRPFAAIALYLRGRGLSAPAIFAMDLPRGLLLLEDLGDALFAGAFTAGAEETTLYPAAIDTLLALHAAPAPGILPVGDGSEYALPDYDAGALAAEVLLLCEWYAPYCGLALEEAAQAAFLTLWRQAFARLLEGKRVLVLRDFHAQNLFWLPERGGVGRVGLIDFQDGVMGSPAYDLVSLLEDARRDVPEPLAAKMLNRYCEGAKAAHRDFDEAAFRAAYAIAGAQRNCKILGIFARLARRDNKPAYLDLLPRVRAHLRRDLAHPELAGLKDWFAAHPPL